jgi:hypothetical protein
MHTIYHLERLVDFRSTSNMTIRVQRSLGHSLVVLCFQAYIKNMYAYNGSKVHGMRPMLPSGYFYMQRIVQLVLLLSKVYPITHTALKLGIDLCNIFRYNNFERELITIVSYL